MKPKALAITGCSGYFAKVLMPLIEEDPDIERVVGIDVNEPPAEAEWSKLEFHKMDIRDPSLEDVIRGAEALVHLAFVLLRTPKDDNLDDINIRGSQEVIKTAARLGIPKLIIASSTVGYGIHPDNPNPLTEESPLRPNEDLYYSRQKAANEAFLDDFCKEYPEIIVTRLRPPTVAGPSADPDQMASMVAKTVPVVRGCDPANQMLHEEDIAQALYMAICEDLPGIFNVTSDEPRSLGQLVESRGGRVFPIPTGLFRVLLWALWRSGASVFAPEWIRLFQYSFIASNDKLKAAGWSPKYTTPETFLAVLAAFGDE
ncbi:MAG: NAD-dependent epimerase/dehydratase family protein [Anaerolineales bacterium]|nr:NAD-dependent epimerase/dehydratase family protein [Anaerolineales bacterium]